MYFIETARMVGVRKLPPSCSKRPDLEGVDSTSSTTLSSLVQGEAAVVSIEEVKARLTQLGWDVPMDGFNDANHKTLDVTGEIRAIVATTNNLEFELTLVRMEQGNTMTVDGALMIMEAREEYWQIVEQM